MGTDAQDPTSARADISAALDHLEQGLLTLIRAGAHAATPLEEVTEGLAALLPGTRREDRRPPGGPGGRGGGGWRPPPETRCTSRSGRCTRNCRAWKRRNGSSGAWATTSWRQSCWKPTSRDSIRSTAPPPEGRRQIVS